MPPILPEVVDSGQNSDLRLEQVPTKSCEAAGSD